VLKRRLLIVVLAFLFVLVFAARNLIIVGGNLHGRYVGGGERGKRIIIKWRHGKRKVIDLVNTHLLILSPLVAREHILVLMGVTT
jgi:hypothetical protein